MKITRACLQLLVSVLVIALLVSARFDVWWGFLFLAACSLVEAAIAHYRKRNSGIEVTHYSR